MNNKINPFHELYVTESFGPESYVRLFSDVLMQHTSALFKPGNVVLLGLPGNGKTMMLNLLKPAIRIAYKRCNVEFPVPAKFNKFIGAGINLIRSSIADFGQRPINDTKDLSELAIYFGDFLNYWVVRDILMSVLALGAELSDEIGIDLSKGKLDEFTNDLKKSDCWFGYLDNIECFEDLQEILKKRVVEYRSYLHFNTDKLSESIVNSKTAVGVPIAETVKSLHKSNIINKDVKVYIRIDQYEELAWLDKGIDGLGSVFKSVVHKLLSTREPNVSYRIGTRHFAWKDEPQQIFGTTATLEPSRNYIMISIEDVLKRAENVKTYLFPKFAEDIFEKRLKANNYFDDDALRREKVKSNLIADVFGIGLDSKEKASRYVIKSREKAIILDKSWPAEWCDFLRNLAKEDPLSARLAEAWARQKGKGEIVNNVPVDRPYPWEDVKKKYWKKERIDQALIQIASRNRQQLIWEGKDDILKLSGDNILAFLSICQHIWEIWLRDSKDNLSSANLPRIDSSAQTLGILEASSNWFEKLSSEKGGGRERKQFILYLGVLLYKGLIEDIKMSNPGHNGFSLDTIEQEDDRLVDKFLKDASDFGDLVSSPHTTKTKDKRKRTKWYLNPILSPYFKIPPAHTKEPKYVSLKELRQWLSNSNVVNYLSEENNQIINKRTNRNRDASIGQMNLFE